MNYNGSGTSPQGEINALGWLVALAIWIGFGYYVHEVMKPVEEVFVVLVGPAEPLTFEQAVKNSFYDYEEN